MIETRTRGGALPPPVKYRRETIALATLLVALTFALFVVIGEAEGAETAPVQDTTATRGQVIQTARSFSGVKYANGYPDPCSRRAGVDCECLNRLVYKRIGVSLPTTPEDQYKTGARRTVDRLRKGDLVFFSEDHSGRITHTGIYAGKDEAGERMIIHASTYWHEVVEKPMKYVEGFAGGRDVLP